MRKVLAVIAVVCVVFTAGSAFAAPRHGKHPVPPADRRMPPRMERPVMPAPMPAPRHSRPRTFTPDMPPEIREKAAELAKLRIDLEEAMTSRPLNKEKALDVYAKIQKVKQEIEAWRFTKRLERIEERQKKGLPAVPEVNPTPDETPAPEETPQPEPTEIESEE